MEMTIVLGVLLLLLVGMVEFGYLLNEYITLTDAARAGARFGSSGKVDPYIRTTSPFTENSDFFDQIDCVIEGTNGHCTTGSVIGNGALDPIILNESTDDVIITFYRVVNGSIEATFGPHPMHGSSGHVSQINSSVVQSNLVSSAPDSGVLVVEIFYAHYQIIKFPIFTSVIPDPMNVHTYAIMPLSLAKPTPVP